MSDQAKGLLSPYLRKKRIQTVKPYIKGKVLDFGCGVGKLSEYFDKEDYVGVDLDKYSIQIARKKYPGYQFYDMQEMRSIKDKFDVIVALAVIEHIENQAGFLEMLKKMLNKNGKIVLTTPHLSMKYLYCLGSRLGLFSLEASKEHKKLINYREIRQFVRISGMKILFYKRFLFGANQLFILEAAN